MKPHPLARAVMTGMLVASALSACQSRPVTPQRLPDAPMPDIGRENPATVYIELARNYLEAGQTMVAMSNARKAVAVDPSSVEALILLSVAEGRLGYTKESEATLQKARSLSPDDPYVANALGTLYCGQRKYNDAHEQFNLAVSNPRNMAPWIAAANAGLCYRDQGRDKEAVAKLQSALQLNPRFSVALLALARLNYDRQQASVAQTYINRYFEVSAPDAESLWMAYQIENALGNQQRAESYAVMLRSRFPDSPQTYRLLGL